MSDVIKLNVKSRSIKVKLDGDQVKEDPEREREKLEQKHKEEVKIYFEKGFAEGQKSVKAQFENYYSEKLLKRFEELHQMFSGFDEHVKEYDRLFEKLVLETAFAISEKIIKAEVSRKPIIAEVLQDSLKRVIGANDVIVRINPADYDNLFYNENNINLDDSFAKIRFEKDERIDTGGCLVETEIGNVDARVSTQLAEMKKLLEAGLAHPPEE
jgi:flagellar assembly protein FliH